MPIPEFVVEMRRLIGQREMWLPAVTAVVQRDDEILLVRRADNGLWTLITGILEPGEEPAVAAAREALEETGVVIMVDRLASTHAPGTAAWAQMDMHARSQWWVRRVGRLTSLVAAVPGFGGAITSKLPVTSVLGAAAQGLVLCAIADEHDMHDEADVVALLGAVMFRR